MGWGEPQGASATTLAERLTQAEATLSELSREQGDRTLWRLVAIWRDKANRTGTRLALAERALRLVLTAGPPEETKAAVAEWRKVAIDGGMAP